MLAPAAMKLGLVAGEPRVPAVPASPVLTVTVTPAATAASLARLIGSLSGSGKGLPPNDSLMTSTSSTTTAYSTAWTKLDVVVYPSWLKTLRPTSDAPGAMPRTRMLQGDGRGRPGLTTWLMSKRSGAPWGVSWAAIELASPKASAPSVGVPAGSPEKSW